MDYIALDKKTAKEIACVRVPDEYRERLDVHAKAVERLIQELAYLNNFDVRIYIE